MNSVSEMTLQMCLMIGVFQLIAIFPGTSCCATIVGALLIGISRVAAAGIYLLSGHSGNGGCQSFAVVKFGFHFTSQEAVWIVGMVVAFLVSVFVIKFLMNYIKRHDFKIFGWYRIVLGIIVLVYAGARTFF